MQRIIFLFFINFFLFLISGDKHHGLLCGNAEATSGLCRDRTSGIASPPKQAADQTAALQETFLFATDMKDLIKGFLIAMADLMLPRLCIVCGRKLNVREKHICLYCMADFPFTRFWKQKHNAMADAFNASIQKGLDAGRSFPETHGPEENQASQHPREPYAFAAALFFFHNGSEYRNIQYSIKYKGDIQAGRHFGRILGSRLASAEHFSDVDIVIPVPLHWSRQWKRGYNQAEIVAKEVAEQLGAELKTDIIIRNRRTRTQTELSAEEKEANVSGAFCISSFSAGGGMEQERISHILLIDDIFTTGSTLYHCFAALRTVFPPPLRISVATLGFAG